MGSERFNVNHIQVQMAMVIKLQSLQRDGLPALTYRNLEEYICRNLWADKTPRSLHVAVNDVLSVKAEDIVRFLAKEAAAARGSSLEEFSDVIGGK
ncbi:MAG: hypothetical protein IKF00_13120 [Solobacterium sp.]|jgi:hypothetical protein|nr:hypothetical protein [Solobacterium sp.]MDO4192828.1 post-transcriptional regulator [Erysipelotrichaceae bacterium]MBQ6488468.1 hypothetical protein [Solobacterium sp.]MBR2846141.1 hypothetical protein [Solobacterium sp.]MBR3344738.1 hypothetical protein [Solobacterium sp.]